MLNAVWLARCVAPVGFATACAAVVVDELITDERGGRRDDTFWERKRTRFERMHRVGVLYWDQLATGGKLDGGEADVKWRGIDGLQYCLSRLVGHFPRDLPRGFDGVAGQPWRTIEQL